MSFQDTSRFKAGFADDADIGDEVRECVAYDAFRKGCRKNKPPLWQNLEPWMRDAIRVAYLQGKLDGGSK